MIYKNGKLVLEVQRDVIDEIEQITHKSIRAIYKGSQLVWMTIYNAIRSCFGSGTWYLDRNWLSDDTWKNN